MEGAREEIFLITNHNQENVISILSIKKMHSCLAFFSKHYAEFLFN